MLIQSNTVRVIVSLLIVFLVSGIQSVAAENAVISKLQGRATAGDANAQFELAEIYYKGNGVMKNYDTAFVWFEKAANQGHAESQHQMGHIYEYGVGLVEKENKKAFEWFHKAAEQGHLAAQKNLAGLYTIGRGVNQNSRKARLWTLRAKELETDGSERLRGVATVPEGETLVGDASFNIWMPLAEQGDQRSQYRGDYNRN